MVMGESTRMSLFGQLNMRHQGQLIAAGTGGTGIIIWMQNRLGGVGIEAYWEGQEFGKLRVREAMPARVQSPGERLQCLGVHRQRKIAPNKVKEAQETIQDNTIGESD